MQLLRKSQLPECKTPGFIYQRCLAQDTHVHGWMTLELGSEILQLSIPKEDSSQRLLRKRLPALLVSVAPMGTKQTQLGAWPGLHIGCVPLSPPTPPHPKASKSSLN